MLTKKIAIYIPSTVDGNQPAPPELIAKWTIKAKIVLAELFGGFTAYQAQGGWYSPELGLIEESVTIVQSFTDAEGLNNLGPIKELAKQIASEMRQEAVSVEVDGTLNFIEA